MIAYKGKKGGSNKKASDNDDNDEDAALPDVNDTKKKMDLTVDRCQKELAKLKVGRASADMFDDVQGSFGTVPRAGQVSVKSPTLVSIAVYDPTLVKVVAEAIKVSGMGLTPTIDGNTITIGIPKPSKESRQEIVKQAGKVAEKHKTDIRQIRRVALDGAKKKGSISEDDVKRYTKEVEAATEKNVEKLSQMVVQKEKEIMNA